MNQQEADAIIKKASHQGFFMIPRGYIRISELKQIINSLVSEDKCEWKQWDDWDNSDTWNTGCGQDFCGWEGVPPEEHGVNFCQHCGKPVKWQLLLAPPKEGE